MIPGLPAWWLALLEQARLGLQGNGGPFWSERFLCGQPLFGALELPFASPAAGLLLAWGPFAWLALQSALLAVGLAAWLRARAALGARDAALMAVLVALVAVAQPEAAVLLGCWVWVPWVLLLAGEAPAWVAAPAVALLACAGSPTLLVLAALASGRGRWRKASWRSAWGIGLLLAAPGLLETLRLSVGQGSAQMPGWPLAFMGSPLLVAQVGLVAVGALGMALGLGRSRPWVLLGPLAAGLALLTPLFTAARTYPPSAVPTYLRLVTRHQAPPGHLPSTVSALDAERWTGASGGLAPEASLRRWRRLSVMGLRAPDTLSLAAVGWLDADPSQPWFQGVPGALVDSAVGPKASRRLGTSLFERPLGLAHQDAVAGMAGWHLEEPVAVAPGRWEQTLPPPGRGWAYLSESYDPGWQALGPQGSQAVVETEAGFMATRVAGVARLRWRYRPPTTWWGAALALVGLGAWIFRAGRIGSIA